MQYKDEFDDGPDFRGAVSSIFGALKRKDHMEPRRPVWAAAIVLSLVLFLGSVLWYSYPREADVREDIAVPIIRADAGPYKIVPKEPGGMEIAHRDSTVFETLRAGQGDGERRIENLLPETEEPMERDQIFAGLKTEIKVEGRPVGHGQDEPEDESGAMDLAAAEQDADNEPVPEQTLAEKTAAPVPEAEQKIAVIVPQSKPDRQIAEEMSRTEPAAGVETYEGSYFAQLGAVSSYDAAERSWNDMQKSISVLKPLNHRIQKADLGARGIYYRIQAGPMDEAKARSVCVAMQAQKPGSCIVARD
ncbi:MAG: SPOR domain-containing protein [Rhodospirillales bacterium]|nr:SPOR domain-containing protein [Rhodospirillales bacterium]MCB9995036.1 SPOR domain-containing protein [Rhodospirillales bacterium]